MPLGYEAEQLALQNYRILYKNIFVVVVNNYELSTWEGYYLELWSKQPELSYVSIRTILSDFGINNIPLYKDFLSTNGIFYVYLFRWKNYTISIYRIHYFVWLLRELSIISLYIS